MLFSAQTCLVLCWLTKASSHKKKFGPILQTFVFLKYSNRLSDIRVQITHIIIETEAQRGK